MTTKTENKNQPEFEKTNAHKYLFIKNINLLASINLNSKKVKRLFYFLFILLLGGCNFNSDNILANEELKKREHVIQEKELAEATNNIKNNIRPEYENPISTINENYSNKTKFIIGIFKIKKPKLEFLSFSSELIEDRYFLVYDTIFYATEIEEIIGPNDDMLYRFLDEKEKNLRNNLYREHENFKSNAGFKGLKEEEIFEIENNPSKIYSREYKLFDTYKEASIYWNNL